MTAPRPQHPPASPAHLNAWRALEQLHQHLPDLIWQQPNTPDRTVLDLLRYNLEQIAAVLDGHNSAAHHEQRTLRRTIRVEPRRHPDGTPDDTYPPEIDFEPIPSRFIKGRTL